MCQRNSLCKINGLRRAGAGVADCGAPSQGIFWPRCAVTVQVPEGVSRTGERLHVRVPSRGAVAGCTESAVSAGQQSIGVVPGDAGLPGRGNGSEKIAVSC